jgi:hypothetical protein
MDSLGARLLLLALSLLFAAGCGMSDEAAAAKDHESSMASWALILRVDGADVKIPLKAMNVLLFKDEEHARQNPSVFQIEGSGVQLIGEIAAADNVDYGEHWERLINKTLTIKHQASSTAIPSTRRSPSRALPRPP